MPETTRADTLMPMASVFVSRKLPGSAISTLEASGHRVDVWPHDLPPPPGVLASKLAVTDAAVLLLTDRVDARLLRSCPRLRVIANVAVGYDNIDVAAASELGIWVTNTPGVLHETTADFAFALLLAVARRVVASERFARAGGWKTWSPTAFLGPDVHGATLGIVGMGQIGQAVARRARGFAMRVVYTSRTRTPTLEQELGIEWRPLEHLLAESDFVSLHVPLTAETQRLLNRERLWRMKPGAILVNTARGPVVDHEALVDALRRGHLGGAGLDVTDPEPLPPEHPLWSFENVVITPHIASASEPTRARMAEMAAANVIAVLEGREPPNPVARPRTTPKRT